MLTLAAVTQESRVRAVAKFFFDDDQKFFVKGVTYGPFCPDASGNTFGSEKQVDRDLQLMREVGVNLLRVYHTPPRWFLDRCAAAGMRVMFTVPWPKHVEFLKKKTAREDIVAFVRRSIETNAGHPAMFGYLVGNEISSTMVRWLGVRRVTEFLERLVAVGRQTDPA